MGSNRYTVLQPTTFDVPLYQPNWEALDQALLQQQQQYDVVKSLDEKVPKHLQQHAPAAMAYKERISAGIDDVAEAYRTGDIASGNKKRNELLRTVTKEWMPGGEAYALEDAYNTVQSILSKYDEMYKDNPSFMNEFAVYKTMSQIKDWDYDAKTGKYSKVVDPLLSEYIDIEKDLDERIAGIKESATEKVWADNQWKYKVGDEYITEKEVRNMAMSMLDQEKYAQQLMVEKWKEYGFESAPQHMLIEQTKKLREQSLASVEQSHANIIQRLDNMSKEEIRGLQNELKQSGFYDDKVDGVVGDNTRNAIEEYFNNKRQEAANASVTDETFSNAIKERYVTPMVEKYAYNKHTKDQTERASYVQMLRNAGQKSAMNALLSTLQKDENTMPVPGVTVHETYENVVESEKNASKNMQVAKAAVDRLFGTPEMQKAFGSAIPTFYGSGYGYISPSDKVNTMTVASSMFQDAVKMATNQLGNTADVNAYNKAVKENYKKLMRGSGTNYTDEQIEMQASMMMNVNTREAIYDALDGYEKTEDAYQMASSHLKYLQQKFSNDLLANDKNDKQMTRTIRGHMYSTEQRLLFSPGTGGKGNVMGINFQHPDVKSMERLISLSGNDITRKQLATELGISESEVVALSNNAKTAISKANDVKNKNIESWVIANPQAAKYSTVSTIMSGQAGKDNFTPDLMQLVNDSEINRLITSREIDNNTLAMIGYTSGGAPKSKWKLVDANVAFVPQAGKNVMMIDVITEWEEGGITRRGKGVVPFASISQEAKKYIYSKGMGMQMLQIDGKPNAQGHLKSDLAIQNADIYGQGWFDDFMSEGNKLLSSTFIERNPISNGQSRSLGGFNMQGVPLYVVQFKGRPNVNAEAKDNFVVMGKEDYNQYIANGSKMTPSQENFYLSQGRSKQVAFDRLDELKALYGRKALIDYSIQSPTYSSIRINDANAGLLGAAGAITSDNSDINIEE